VRSLRLHHLITHANQCSPKPPPPFIPSFEQLRIARLDKDTEINSRIRGPPLPRFLSLEDDAEVSRLLEKRGLIAKVGGLLVTEADLGRLRPGTWLNDEIINFYGQLILERSTSHPRNMSLKNGARLKKSSILNVHYFNSFFFEKLVKDGYQKGRLAKWTKKVRRASMVSLECVTYGHSSGSSTCSRKMLLCFLSIMATRIGQRLR
jgi:sentrin-specific protease 1